MMVNIECGNKEALNFVCSVTAKKAIFELSACSVMAKADISELFVCPVTAKEALSELSNCPVTAKEAVVNLSVPVPHDGSLDHQLH